MRDRNLPRTERSRPQTLAIVMLLAFWLILLVWIVMWKLHEPFIGRPDMRRVKLIPFIAVGGSGESDPSEVLLNFLIFVPVGAYLDALFLHWPTWRLILLAAALSTAFETAQYLTAVGSSDVSDVLSNTAGAAAGAVLVALLHRHRPTETAPAVVVSGVIVTVLAAGASATYIALQPRLPSHGHLIVAPASAVPGARTTSATGGDARSWTPPTDYPQSRRINVNPVEPVCS